QPEPLRVTRGLDQPGEVDDAVGAPEVGDEVGARHVRRGPFDVRKLELRESARKPEYRDVRLVAERLEQARADVACCPDDDDADQELTSSSSTSVRNAFA